MTQKLKIRLLLSTGEAVLLYGVETWTVTKKLAKCIDGCYTRMLQKALNVSWKAYLTNEELYQDLPRVTEKIQQRRMQLAGHAVRHPEVPVSHLVLWQSIEGKPNRGRKQMTYVNNLLLDSGMANVEEMRSCMVDQDGWQNRVKALGRLRGRPK